MIFWMSEDGPNGKEVLRRIKVGSPKSNARMIVVTACIAFFVGVVFGCALLQLLQF